MWWARLLNNISGFLGGATPIIGDYESIATTIVGSGGTSSINFGTIPSTYKHLQIRGIAQCGGSFLTMRANGDSGSNYDAHEVYGNGSGNAQAAAFITRTNMVIDFMPASTVYGAFVLDILDYRSTSKNKTMRGLCGFDSNGGGVLGLMSGLWRNNTTAITSLEIVPASGSIAQYSHFALYGIKG